MRPALLVAASALLVVANPASAQLTVFQNDLAGFNAAGSAPPVAIDFDALTGNLAGATVAGVTFLSPDGNTLDVVTAASTFTPAGQFGGIIDASTNVLPATSGTRVLSPGGVELVAGPALGQRDSLTLQFGTPITAFGLDVLFQSYDFASLASYTLQDVNGTIFSGSINTLDGGGGGAPAGSFFLGFVSTFAIASLTITDGDGDAAFPDANMGYDSFRFVAANVPEPATWAMMIGGIGLAGGMARRRRAIPALA